MSDLPYYVLLLPMMLLSSISYSDSATDKLDCETLFSGIIENEPLLKDELGELKSSCDIEKTTQNGHYWSCIQTRMDQGEKSFDRFIVSANVCDSFS